MLHVGEGNVQAIGVVGNGTAEKIIGLDSRSNDNGVLVRHDVVRIILGEQEALMVVTAEHKLDPQRLKRLCPLGVHIRLDIKDIVTVEGGHIGANVCDGKVKLLSLSGKRSKETRLGTAVVIKAVETAILFGNPRGGRQHLLYREGGRAPRSCA